jgi:CBS domain-containing protein
MVQDDKRKTPESDPVERVPAENYVADGMWEEERIMAERAAPARELGSYDLRVSVKNLELGKPMTVPPETTLRDAIALMQSTTHSIGCVLVVEGAKLTGIFTERDLLLKIAGRRLDWDAQVVRDFMTPNPEALSESANLAFVLNMMTAGGFRHVPIVDDQGAPKAVVSIRDVVAYICSFFEKEIENLPPRPEILHPEVRESL